VVEVVDVFLGEAADADLVGAIADDQLAVVRRGAGPAFGVINPEHGSVSWYGGPGRRDATKEPNRRMFSWTARKFKQQLAEATTRISAAQDELSSAMSELTVSDRADKQIIGERLRKALTELVAARHWLAELEEPSR
jgi:hypothetical protein